MSYISLTRGLRTHVDDEDVERLSQYKWFAATCKSSGRTYAARGVRCKIDGKVTVKIIMMHREIMNPHTGMVVDHINFDGLDNRRSNLRVCTHAQNCTNTSRKPGASGYRGVYRKPGGWQVVMTRARRQLHVGFFHSLRDAVLAYNAKARELHGQFAKIHEIPA